MRQGGGRREAAAGLGAAEDRRGGRTRALSRAVSGSRSQLMRSCTRKSACCASHQRSSGRSGARMAMTRSAQPATCGSTLMRAPVSVRSCWMTSPPCAAAPRRPPRTRRVRLRAGARGGAHLANHVANPLRRAQHPVEHGRAGPMGAALGAALLRTAPRAGHCPPSTVQGSRRGAPEREARCGGGRAPGRGRPPQRRRACSCPPPPSGPRWQRPPVKGGLSPRRRIAAPRSSHRPGTLLPPVPGRRARARVSWEFDSAEPVAGSQAAGQPAAGGSASAACPPERPPVLGSLLKITR